jgi:hypothetical protein
LTSAKARGDLGNEITLTAQGLRREPRSAQNISPEKKAIVKAVLEKQTSRHISYSITHGLRVNTVRTFCGRSHAPLYRITVSLSDIPNLYNNRIVFDIVRKMYVVHIELRKKEA